MDESSPTGFEPRVRATPYLASGGTFVFPSIHWHLSRSLREDPVQHFKRNQNYPTGLPNLDRLLAGSRRSIISGFPNMRTTALVGIRGSMKSHLAYSFMLSHALGTVPQDSKPKNILLVSLRDDMGAAKNTLGKLIEEQNIGGMGSKSQEVLEGLIKADRIEILHNWPGCITPNEFFHRIFVALARKRAQKSLRPELNLEQEDGDKKFLDEIPDRDTSEIVIVNGLDHLDVKFPLCSEEKVFVPSLIALFRCFKVCSVVISADDKTGRSDIRPLADLILEFSEANPDDCQLAGIDPSSWQRSKVTAKRVPAGHIGGLWGILSRDQNGTMRFFPVLPE